MLKNQELMLTRTLQPQGHWIESKGNQVQMGLCVVEVVGFGGESAGKLNFVFLHKKINLFLASYRLSCYKSCFSGEYSPISQEYPPSKLKVRDTI